MAKKLKEVPADCWKMTVRLNGTDENPWLRMGLTQNPIPQLGKYEYDRWCLHLQKLGADPIPDTDYIRNHLRGYTDELVDLCCRQFKKGEMVEFDVYWPKTEGEK